MHELHAHPERAEQAPAVGRKRDSGHGKTEEMLSHLIPAGGLAGKVTADLLREISGIVGYEGEDPADLVAAVRKATALGAHQLTSEAEAGALRTIAGIVGYEGTDGEQLVEAVRKRVLTCASCEAEDVLHEIREIVGYTPEQGDKGLADAVRAFADRRPAEVPDCADCTELREDLDRSTRVIEELRAELQEALDSDELLANEIYRAKNAIANLRDELTLAQQARDEWEQRAVQAESNVETMEAELRNREAAPAVPSCKETYLLDIALKALRGEGPDADQLAGLIDAARRAA